MKFARAKQPKKALKVTVVNEILQITCVCPYCKHLDEYDIPIYRHSDLIPATCFNCEEMFIIDMGIK